MMLTSISAGIASKMSEDVIEFKGQQQMSDFQAAALRLRHANLRSLNVMQLILHTLDCMHCKQSDIDTHSNMHAIDMENSTQ